MKFHKHLNFHHAEFTFKLTCSSKDKTLPKITPTVLRNFSCLTIQFNVLASSLVEKFRHAFPGTNWFPFLRIINEDDVTSIPLILHSLSNYCASLGGWVLLIEWHLKWEVREIIAESSKPITSVFTDGKYDPFLHKFFTLTTLTWTFIICAPPDNYLSRTTPDTCIVRFSIKVCTQNQPTPHNNRIYGYYFDNLSSNACLFMRNEPHSMWFSEKMRWSLGIIYLLHCCNTWMWVLLRRILTLIFVVPTMMIYWCWKGKIYWHLLTWNTIL